MTGNTSTTKALWGVASLCFALIIALFTALAQGFLWEGPNSRANQKTADATMVASDAAQKETMNKLQGVLETAKAAIEASRLQSESNQRASENLSRATVIASQHAADGLYKAAEEASKAQNAEYYQITKRFIGDPVEKTDELNTQLARLEIEINTGHDSRTGQQLSIVELANRQSKKEALEVEHRIQSEITKKNWSDAMRMVTGATNGLFGGMDELIGNEPKPTRRIIQEP